MHAEYKLGKYEEKHEGVDNNIESPILKSKKEQNLNQQGSQT